MFFFAKTQHKLTLKTMSLFGLIVKLVRASILMSKVLALALVWCTIKSYMARRGVWLQQGSSLHSQLSLYFKFTMDQITKCLRLVSGAEAMDNCDRKNLLRKALGSQQGPEEAEPVNGLEDPPKTTIKDKFFNAIDYIKQQDVGGVCDAIDKMTEKILPPNMLGQAVKEEEEKQPYLGRNRVEYLEQDGTSRRNVLAYRYLGQSNGCT